MKCVQITDLQHFLGSFVFQAIFCTLWLDQYYRCHLYKSWYAKYLALEIGQLHMQCLDTELAVNKFTHFSTVEEYSMSNLRVDFDGPVAMLQF